MIDCVFAPDPILILHDNKQEETITSDHKLYDEYSKISQTIKYITDTVKQSCTGLNTKKAAPSIRAICDKIEQIVNNKFKLKQLVDPKETDISQHTLIQSADNLNILFVHQKYTNVLLLGTCIGDQKTCLKDINNVSQLFKIQYTSCRIYIA